MDPQLNSPKSGRSLSTVNQAVSVPPKKLSEEDLEELYQELDTRDHIISIHRLCEKFHTDISNGMTNEVAAKALIQNGPNALSPPKVTPAYIKFLQCMFSGFALILWICCLLCFSIYALEIYFKLPSENIEWFGIIIFVICIISGVFAYFQESKNTKIMDSFKKMVPSVAMVIRDGQRREILAEEIVVGDLVEIQMGDKIPADIRVIECSGLRVENSSITGNEIISSTILKYLNYCKIIITPEKCNLIEEKIKTNIKQL